MENGVKHKKINWNEDTILQIPSFCLSFDCRKKINLPYDELEVYIIFGPPKEFEKEEIQFASAFNTNLSDIDSSIKDKLVNKYSIPENNVYMRIVHTHKKSTITEPYLMDVNIDSAWLPSEDQMEVDW